VQNDPLCDGKIIESWRRNAAPWTRAVRERQIDSRRQVTDQAIIDAVMSYAPHSVLDIGCGEGWLIRALAGSGMHLTGIDAVPALIESAQAGGGGEFHVASYHDLGDGKMTFQTDVAVCNFSLIGKESVQSTFAAVPGLLKPQGVFIVQTLHPVSACGILEYKDGWRAGSWDGFGKEFYDPAPWYFRTVGSWLEMFREHKLRLLELREPLHPATGKPASAIFIADVMR
jgi:2-polyprenyl-3-methyl-5-hydroxy-6-metoxy-1,4-benzoquinol methylase